MKTRFSIIIPIYNEHTRINAMLNSLATATQNVIDTTEIIVSDGGSNDGSIEALLQHPLTTKLNLRILQGEKGRGQQLARAAKETTGEILIFLHADTRIDENYFTELNKAISNGAQWGCARLRYDKPQLSLQLIAFFAHLRVRYQSLVFGDQAMFCTADFYQQTGGFWPMFFMEDYNFSLRAAKLAKPVVIPATALSSARFYLQHGIWKANWRVQQNKRRYRSGKYSLEELYQLYAG